MNGRLDAEDLLLLLGESTGPGTIVRDFSILCASVVRPDAALIKEPVWSTVSERTGAILHSITRWEPLDMWNAGLAWSAARVFAAANGYELDVPAIERMSLTVDMLDGRVESVPDISARLTPFLRTK
jgi:death on curing protein